MDNLEPLSDAVDTQLKFQIDKLLDGIKNAEDLTRNSHQQIIIKIVEELENLAMISRKKNNLSQAMYYYEELSRQTSSQLLMFAKESSMAKILQIKDDRLESYMKDYWPEIYAMDHITLDQIDYDTDTLLSEFAMIMENWWKSNLKNRERLFFEKLVYKYFTGGNNQACILFHHNQDRKKSADMLKRFVKQRIKYINSVQDITQLIILEQNLSHTLETNKYDSIAGIKAMERSMRMAEFLLKKFPPGSQEDIKNGDNREPWTQSFENMTIVKRNLIQDVDSLYSSNKMGFADNLQYYLCHSYNFFSKLLENVNCTDEAKLARKEAKYFYDQVKKSQAQSKSEPPQGQAPLRPTHLSASNQETAGHLSRNPKAGPGQDWSCNKRLDIPSNGSMSPHEAESKSVSNKLYMDDVSSNGSLAFEDIEKFNVTRKDVLLKMYCRIDSQKYKISIISCVKFTCLIVYIYNKNIKFLKYVLVTMSQFNDKFGEVKDNDMLVKNLKNQISRVRIYKDEVSIKDFMFYRSFDDMVQKNSAVHEHVIKPNKSRKQFPPKSIT